MDTDKRHHPLDLYKRYNPEEYPAYDTFDAIDCARCCNIPMDYNGIIGVPITYMAIHCPEQFELVGEFHHGSDGPFDLAKPIVNGKEKYVRIAIRKVKNKPGDQK